jgi:uncharacterized protein
MRYHAFSRYLKERYGEPVRRISLNAGFPCPERAGGRCVYCNESGFSDFAAAGVPLREQMERSIAAARRQFGAEKFMAYFQNGTGTNAPPDRLKSAYDVIREYPEIVALSISTRPDCVDDDKLDLIAEYLDRYEVWVEYGVQTSRDKTLKAINRGHGFAQSEAAIIRTAQRGIKPAAHIILGLPGEGRADIKNTARCLSELPVAGVKMHMLHVLRDTALDEWYRRGEISLLSRDDYITAACDLIENLRRDIVILRLASDARKEYLIAPEWMNSKATVIKGIEDELERRGTCQGSFYATN